MRRYQYPDQDARDPQPALAPAMTEQQRAVHNDLIVGLTLALSAAKRQDYREALKFAGGAPERATWLLSQFGEVPR